MSENQQLQLERKLFQSALKKTLLKAKKKLHVEAGAPQKPQEHDGTMEVVGQTVKNVEHQLGTTSPPHCSPPKPVPFYPTITRRSQETSLSFLTRRFAELLSHSVDGMMDLKLVTQELSVSKRRVYDITNVLEGIKLIKKTSKNHIQWLGGKLNAVERRDLTSLAKEEEKLDELIQSCSRQINCECQEFYSRRFAYLTYEDVSQLPSLKEQTVIVIRAPAETQVQVPHPEECLQVHITSINGPIEAFLLSEKNIPTESTTASSVSDSLLNPATSGNDFFPLNAMPSFNMSSEGATAQPIDTSTSPSSPLRHIEFAQEQSQFGQSCTAPSPPIPHALVPHLSSTPVHQLSRPPHEDGHQEHVFRPSSRLEKTGCASIPCSAAKLHIITLLEHIKQQQMQLAVTVNSLAAARGTETPNVNLPLSTLSEVEEFEEWLKDQASSHAKQNMVFVLGAAGGQNPKRTTWNILSRLFSDAVAKQINWKGRNGKKCFKEMLTRSLLIRAVRKNPSSACAADTDIDCFAIRWFNHASDRGDGRKERQKAKEAST